MKHILNSVLLLVIVFSLSCKKIIVQEDHPVGFPNELTAINNNNSLTEIKLTWTDNSDNEKGFRIERKSKNSDYILIATVGENIRYCTDSPPPGDTYTYRVYAFNDNGRSLYSNEFTGAVGGLPKLSTLLPQRVAGTGFVTSGGNIIDDGGTEAAYIYCYQAGIVWDTKPDPTVGPHNITADIYNGDGSATAFNSIIYNLKPNTTYYIRSYAINQIGAGYSDQITYTTSDSALTGSQFGGGIVFYNLKAGDIGYDPFIPHGLIADSTDPRNAPTFPWSNRSEWTHPAPVGALSTAVGTGRQNTTNIVAAFGNGNYAAKRCYDLNLNGHDDWFLPSEQELYRLYLNYTAVTANSGIGLPMPCWSSTEAKRSDAPLSYAGLYVYGATPQGQFADYETLPYWVMAIRAF